MEDDALFLVWAIPATQGTDLARPLGKMQDPLKLQQHESQPSVPPGISSR